MRRTLLKTAAAALALLLALTVTPFAFVGADVTVPEGYNAHDYEKCVAFLEIEDADGVKNGEKLSETYDPADPATWGRYWYADWDGVQEERDRFAWTEQDGELRIAEVCTGFLNVIGPADFADCSALTMIACNSTGIESADLSGCCALEKFNCQGGKMTELDVSECPALRTLRLEHNPIAELDLTHNPVLSCLSCYFNTLRHVDLSGNQMLEVSRIDAVGGGTVSCYLHTWSWFDYGFRLTPEPEHVSAQPDEGYRFVGWFDQDDNLLSEQTYYEGHETYGGDLAPVWIAKFLKLDTVPGSGDANTDGETDITDALIALRVSMGLIELDYDGIVSADMDESGDITAADALLILRGAMGLL